jgi:hypothetical protein
MDPRDDRAGRRGTKAGRRPRLRRPRLVRLLVLSGLLLVARAFYVGVVEPQIRGGARRSGGAP